MARLHLRDACQLDRRVDGFGARRNEKHPRVVDGCQRGDALRDPFGGFVCERIEDVEGLEPAHLVADRVDNLVAPVADGRVPQARQPVDIGLALIVVDESALTAHDCDEVGASRAGKGVKESTHGQPFGIVVAGGAVGGGGVIGGSVVVVANSPFFGMINFCP